MNRLQILAVASFCALTAVTAQAGPSVQISLRDLSGADSGALAERVHVAAEEACGPVRSTADTRFSALTEADSDHRACVSRATYSTMARIQAAYAARQTPVRAP